MCSTHSGSVVTSKQTDELSLLHHLDNDFWQFSLELYANPEVAQYCLKLQDQHDMQVNILLYSLWLSFEGCILEPQRIKQNSQLQNWLKVIIPNIRDARKQVGENSKQDPLYKQLKASELMAEQRAQAILFQLDKEPSIHQRSNNGFTENTFLDLLEENLRLSWQAFQPTSEKNQPPEQIIELSKWMIIHCQRKIADKLNIKP